MQRILLIIINNSNIKIAGLVNTYITIIYLEWQSEAIYFDRFQID